MLLHLGVCVWVLLLRYRQVSLKGNVLSKNVQHHIATLNRAIAIGSISLAADDADAGWWELEEEKMEKEF